ncbi:MAG TPA: 4-(cytidine 5'-diphospho)-2-C-methyl-D-erythritol kinase [Clostridiales bacterium]|jgi:4-diphosphocytidyl-2-C-methyl-D-erythritol kinase|nr:4-(cytidine 5'-diphospho)-2-C-methyl-D-erythritol kinase [Clostridiales bacterium]HQP70373.1 4-(cytidine 5'-diphospho)-2-C-methyl-D-erythritol kinase [Clostridiales bacterium]
MIVRANCKLNLHLKVTGKLPDGYHSLETIFQEIPFYDEIDIVSSDKDVIQFTSKGINIPGSGNNICVKAAELLKNNFNINKGCRITLKKNVPIGAGLGGGSSDAAAVLKALNVLWGLNLTDEELEKLGLKLGADVPFFIKGGCAWAEGKGELLKRIEPLLKNGSILLIYPHIHISTPDAYKKLNLNLTNLSGNVIFAEVSKPGVSLNVIRAGFINDFESVVFREYPEIGHIKELLLSEGAALAAMSGSGSSVFGFFTDEKRLIRASGLMDKNYFVHAVKL